MTNKQNLVLVESPAKAKTIENFLGKDFEVLATMGHLIDLPKSKLGVDVDHKYEPEYTKIKGKGKLISLIKKKIKEAQKVFLAQDPDREGEAIAWQVYTFCKKPDEKIQRVVFHEITPTAVKNAIQAPRTLDFNLVEAQKARRVLDRLVGYPLSQLIWKKIRYGLSAGRVQSAALRLIVERQEEIDAFKPETMYYLGISLDESNVFWLHNKKKLSKLAVSVEIFKKLDPWLQNINTLKVKNIERKIQKVSPPPPFVTSSLQQAANKTFGFSAKTTMALAQELYQGIEIKGMGRKALITYMRTDSVRLSDTAIKGIRDYIKKSFGDNELEPNVRRYKTKAKLAQEAHEAIRPVYFNLPPEKLKGKLKELHLKLYTLIWNRSIATQMKAAEYTNVIAHGEVENAPAEINKVLDEMNGEFILKQRLLTYAGFKKLFGMDAKELTKLPFEEDDVLDKINYIKDEFETTPPPPYTDATLVKKLEKLGIGRPSTFANIIETLIRRTYIERRNQYLIPTDNGKVVTKFLKEHFANIVDYKFTAEMEQELDEIALGKIKYVEFLNKFYPNFIKDIELKEKTVNKQDLVILEETDKKCPKCGADMVLKLGRYGKFYSCSRFPECDGMLPYLDESKYVIPEKAKTGEWVLKASKYGKFWAHKDYPKVKETSSLLLKETCPQCGAHLVERKGKRGRSFIACSAYPKCKYIKK